ncbi:MAG: PQQ-binding-like beta-propeller repeat protein [Verrucomicrobia bacterium]|nr:PQQ-binding-like beta-propeller repeat protein [Verrucomicrobiota bacterium]
MAALLFAAALALTGCGERAAAPAPKSAPPPVTAWPMTRGGPALTGSVPAPLPRAPQTAWTFTAHGPVNAEAAIARGRIYVGTDKGRLHCLAAESGRELWHFDAKDTIGAAPAVSGDRVYLTSNDGNLYALDATTGKEAWKFSTDEKISSGANVIASPTGEGEWVLINGYDGTTRVLSAADGKVVWTYKTNDYINGAPAIVDRRFVVFGGCDAKLHVVNLRDGTPVHSIEAEAYIPSSIGTYGTMAFCGNYANQAVAFDVPAGKVAWTYQDRQMPFFSSPAVTESLVLIGSRDKHLHAIQRTTGAGAWKFKTSGRVEGSPIAFTDGVVFGSADGRLYAASLDTGAEIWRLELGEAIVASPAFGENLILVGGEKGTVFAIRGTPGK